MDPLTIALIAFFGKMLSGAIQQGQNMAAQMKKEAAIAQLDEIMKQLMQPGSNADLKAQASGAVRRNFGTLGAAAGAAGSYDSSVTRTMYSDVFQNVMAKLADSITAREQQRLQMAMQIANYKANLYQGDIKDIEAFDASGIGELLAQLAKLAPGSSLGGGS